MHLSKLLSAVFVQPCAGVRAGGLTGEMLLLGVVVRCFHQSGCYASVTDWPRDICMDYVHDPSSYDISKIGGMAFGLDFKASQVLVMFNSCLHMRTRYQKRCRYFLSDSLAYEARPKTICVMACEVWERVA